MKRKLLCVLLALVLTIPVLQANALAEETVLPDAQSGIEQDAPLETGTDPQTNEQPPEVSENEMNGEGETENDTQQSEQNAPGSAEEPGLNEENTGDALPSGDDAQDAGGPAGTNVFGETVPQMAFNPDIMTLSAYQPTMSTKVQAEKVADGNAAQMINEKITEKTWGKPTITVNGNSHNTTIQNHDSTVPSVKEASFYFRWDSQYLYIGMTSPDDDLYGHKDNYSGDAIQFWLAPGMDKTGDFNMSMNRSADNSTVQFASRNAESVGGNNAALSQNTLHNVIYDENEHMLYIMAALPLTDLGILEDDLVAGYQLAFRAWRVSAIGSSDADAYAGWLAWGSVDTPNMIVLNDGTPGSANKEEGPIADLSKKSNFPVMEINDADGHRMVTTGSGSYTVYVDNANMLGQSVNQFTLQKIGDGKAKEVGYGYTDNGLVDLVVDASGAVYVTGGASTRDLDQYASGGSVGAEKAVLSVWRYDEDLGSLTEYTKKVSFSVETTGYSYLTSAVSGNTIYTVYIGVTSGGQWTLQTFTFNTQSHSWSNAPVSTSLEAEPKTIRAYAAADGLTLVYDDGNTVYQAAGGASQALDAQGTLLDAYQAADGTVHVLYESNGTVMQKIVGGSSADTTIPAGQLLSMAQVGGKYYVVAMKPGEAAAATLYASENGITFSEAKTVQLDKVIQPLRAPMLSVDGEDILAMFYGQRGNAKSLYFGVLSTAAEIDP